MDLDKLNTVKELVADWLHDHTDGIEHDWLSDIGVNQILRLALEEHKMHGLFNEDVECCCFSPYFNRCIPCDSCRGGYKNKVRIDGKPTVIIAANNPENI